MAPFRDSFVAFVCCCWHLVAALAVPTPIPRNGCAYQSCPAAKTEYINVHLVPHTHDDVGWLKTVDQYYFGGRNDIQKAGVQYILDSVIDELQADPERRFIYAEVVFFWQWWQEQTEQTKSTVRDLVNEGRLEFINGGWCMNDEAATHYVDIIDQMSLGLRFLNETFGECGRPRIAWQIDPFGHSREQALLFSLMGFDGLFFGRIDHEDKRQRMADKTMEMIWHASGSLGESGSMFTGVNYNMYQPPPGFCFDVLCDDKPIVDNPKSREFNVDSRVTEFLDYCKRQSQVYASDNILLTMGGDFTYQDANMWFKNMDKLIKYANERQKTNGSRFNLFYSTPSCYVKALNDAGLNWPPKTDDFFPYGSDAHSYWTGYFTSRPALKYMIRQASNLFQSCKQMAAALALIGAAKDGDVSVMERAMGIMQHHDAVTGTEKQHVADDYARLLDEGVVECQSVQSAYYRKVLPLTDLPLPQVSFCQLNVSQCEISETSAKFVVNVYNPLSRFVDKYVRIPVAPGASYDVLDPKGHAIDSQLVPVATSIQAARGRRSEARDELVFLASRLPPLGSKSYYIARSSGPGRMFKSKSKLTTRPAEDDYVIASDKVKATVDKETGLLSSVNVEGKTYYVQQEFLWYPGFYGNNEISRNRSSGAYIFRPNGTDAYPIKQQGKQAAQITAIYTGPLVQEIHQMFDTWVTQVIRIYRGEKHVEFDWMVGPIPVSDGVGKEVISRLTTTMFSSDGTFYTDANGRQTVKREVDARESYRYTPTESVSANYYPVNSFIYIKGESEKSQATLVVDRAQGGSSLNGGMLELMVHRRLLHDDSFGVDEQLNETAYGDGLAVRGTHYLVLSEPADAAQHYRLLAQELYKKPQLSFVPTKLPFNKWIAHYKTQRQIISRTLPEDVNIVSLEEIGERKVLLRLEHIFDINEDDDLSKRVSITLAGLFSGHKVVAVEETTLGANQWKKDSKRLDWKHSAQETKQRLRSDNSEESNRFVVELETMEIRAFIIELAPSKY